MNTTSPNPSQSQQHAVREQFADLIIEALNDIENKEEVKRVASISQTALDAIRIETLVKFLNTLIGLDEAGHPYLTAVSTSYTEPHPHVIVKITRTNLNVSDENVALEPTATQASDLAERIEASALDLTDLIQSAVRAADGKANEETRKLIHAQTALLEALLALGLKPSAHCAELMANW